MRPENVRVSSPADLFSDAFYASPIGIVLEDLDGCPLFVNPALCAMLGFNEEELRRKHCVEFSPPEDSEKDWALFQELRAGHIGTYRLDKRYYRKNGTLMWGRLSISLLRHQPSPVVIAMVEDITEMRLAQEELEQSKATLQKLSGRLIEAQEEERRRIAREIHDDISQRLALLANGLLQVSGTRLLSETSLQLDALYGQASDIAHALHVLSHRLHSSKLDTLGLAPAMTNLCREVADQHGIEITCVAGDLRDDVSQHTALCLFRVLQEALSNAVKHSRARRIDVRLERRAGMIDLHIRDAGVGFHPSVALRGNGIGLMSMKERVSLVKGTIAISSKPQEGTEIHVRVPLVERRRWDEVSV
jgi:PAS domain S-box-containing protein